LNAVYVGILNHNPFASRGLAEELIVHIPAVYRVKRISDYLDLLRILKYRRGVLPNLRDVWTLWKVAGILVYETVLLVRERDERLPRVINRSGLP
jgi:hypothetical protein